MRCTHNFVVLLGFRLEPVVGLSTANSSLGKDVLG